MGSRLWPERTHPLLIATLGAVTAGVLTVLGWYGAVLVYLTDTWGDIGDALAFVFVGIWLSLPVGAVLWLFFRRFRPAAVGAMIGLMPAVAVVSLLLRAAEYRAFGS